jgi:glycosyltransferase involved in cell wall biosynthesis
MSLDLSALSDRTDASHVARSSEKKLNIFIIHASAVLTDSRANGDGLLCYRFIRELALRGHRIAVACESVELQAPLPANVALYPLATRFPTKLAERFEYALRMRRLFVRLNAIERFDLAHQLNPVYAGISLGLAGIDVPIVLGPYVAHWPSLRASRIKARIADTIAAAQQRFAAAIIVSGRSARARITSAGVAPDTVHTVPYGIDLDAFPEQPFPSGDPTILYLAGFAKRKGVLVLLAAFDLVAARIPNARLIVAGDGVERDQVRGVAARSPYRDRITFVGSVARKDVSRLIGRSTVYCLASFGEPYGMSLIEAMATGRAVVATNVGGPADLVDPRGGALVPPADPAAMARALETILLDPPLAQAMGAFNRQAVEAFSWDAVTDKLEAVYGQVVDRSRAAVSSQRNGRADARADRA